MRLIEHGQIIGRTPVSAVLSTKEDRAFASFDAGDPLIENVAALETAIAKADIVHTFLGYCLSYPIAELCRKHNKILSVDCSFCDAPGKQTDAILRECDYWKGNEGEVLRLTGAADVETALLHLAGMVRRGAVVTLGGEGSLGTERGRTPVFVPAAPVERFVDACGAGDAYAAGFLFGLADDEPFAACMKHGAAPDSAEARQLVKRLQDYITERCYPCTKEILAGLGQMYTADERFRKNIDRHADGTAAFLREAIGAYCGR